MNFVCSREIKLNSQMWEPELFGIFAKYKSGVTFYFSNHFILYGFEENQTGPSILAINPSGKSFSLPYNWCLVTKDDMPVLLTGPLFAINLVNKAPVSPIPQDWLEEYKNKIFPEKYFETHDFCFGDYRISHRGSSGYTCTKQGECCWNFQGKAYLYSEIKQFKNNIYFATAGCSGYFYILDLESGTSIASIKTGGTSCVERIGNLCYFLKYDGVTNLLCVDLNNGGIVDSIILPGKASELSRIQIIDNKLHAITFQYRRGNLDFAIWNTVQL